MNLRELGRGSHGRVYLWREQMTAIKRVALVDGDGVSTTVLREVQALRQLNGHPNIMRLVSVRWAASTLFIEMELLPLRLTTLLTEPISPSIARKYLHDILAGVCHCHEHRIMHRDLKPDNLNVGFDGRLKLTDFGLARHELLSFDTDAAYTPQMVTLWYRAREILVEAVYDCKVDIWSVGCIYAEMLTARVVFPGESEIAMVHLIDATLPSRNDGKCALRDAWSATVADQDIAIILSCLEERSARPSAAELLRRL